MGTCLSSIIVVTSIVYSSTYAETIVCPKDGVVVCQCDTAISGELCILDCTTVAKNCLGDSLVCRDNDDCTIVCGASSRGCQGATITCPKNADCIADCNGASNSCNNLIVDAFNVASYSCLGGTNCGAIDAVHSAAPTTVSPTTATANPTTSSPTTETANPTTAIPTTATLTPTLSPTIPTVSPTLVPTSSPTIPTVSPTLGPTSRQQRITGIWSDDFAYDISGVNGWKIYNKENNEDLGNVFVTG
eukprot:357915_1